MITEAKITALNELVYKIKERWEQPEPRELLNLIETIAEILAELHPEKSEYD